MLFKALRAAVYGIDANLIDVEVDYSGVVSDQDHFHTVGLPDAAVRESRDRVRAAMWIRPDQEPHKGSATSCVFWCFGTYRGEWENRTMISSGTPARAAVVTWPDRKLCPLMSPVRPARCAAAEQSGRR